MKSYRTLHNTSKSYLLLFHGYVNQINLKILISKRN